MAVRRKAAFMVTVGGRPVSSAFNRLLTEIQVTDSAGQTADTAAILLSDKGGVILLPSKNDPLQIALGWEGGTLGVVFDGKIEEVRSTGGRSQGRMLSISAKSADTDSKIKEHREKHWDDSTLGDVMQDAGSYAGVSVQVHPSLASIKRDWWGMNGQSFIAFGDKIAREVGGMFKIRNNQAILVPRNEGIGAGGAALTTITAQWGRNLIEWDLTPARGRPQFSSFVTRWYDYTKAKWNRKSVDGQQAAQSASTDRYSEYDEDTAGNRAGSSKKGGDREKGGGTVVIDGEPNAKAEANCNVIGARPGIDGTYRIDSAKHQYSRRGGYVTSLTVKEPDGDAGTDGRTPTDGGGGSSGGTPEAGQAAGAGNVG